MDDKRYGVRISTFNCINPFTIDLRGCGQLYIVPGREYYFMNAPINFINYAAQLIAMNVTYKITNDTKGCYYTVDLTDYFKNDPTYIMSKIKKQLNPIVNEPAKPEEPKASVVIASDDFAPRNEVVSEGHAEAELNEMIAKDLQELEVSEEPIKEIIEAPEIEKETTVESEEPKTYTETELSRLGKVKLLEISASLGLDYSDINTKKEIRDGILAAQNK